MILFLSTNEEYISVTNGCIRFIESYRFLSINLDGLVKNLNEGDFKTLEKEFPNKWQNLNKKLAHPYEYFISIDDYQKPVSNSNKEDFFSKLKNKSPDDEEIQRTKEIIERFDLKNGEQLCELYLKSDVILLVVVFENFFEKSMEKNGIDHLFSVSLLGYTGQRRMKCTGIVLKTLQYKDMILLLQNNI